MPLCYQCYGNIEWFCSLHASGIWISAYARVLTNSLVDEEAALSRALAIRTKAIEKVARIKFERIPPARLERLSFGRGQSAAAQYDALTGDILFSTVIWSDLNVRLKKPLRLASGEEVATDQDSQELADHELGHALADQVSQKNGAGKWFLPEKMQTLKQPEAFGLSVVSEGVAVWFAKTLHPSRSVISEKSFPANAEELRIYVGSSDLMIYGGGYWIVRDILDKYGERGLIWLIKNPLSLSMHTMRADAIAYRKRALEELAK